MIINDLPCPIGESLAGKDAAGTLVNTDKCGRPYVIPANRMTALLRGNKQRFTGKPLIGALMRNTSGLTMLGKRLVQIVRAAGYTMTQEFDGYSATLANKGVGLLDPYLPTTGVVDDDIAWVFFGGPLPCLLPLVASDHTADIAVGDGLVAATGTTTGVTTSGRITHVRFVNSTVGGTQASLNAYDMSVGLLGRAMSARTSQETTAGADLLVDFFIKYW